MRSLRAASLAILVGTVARIAATQPQSVLPDGPWGQVELAPIEIRLPATMVPDVALPVEPWVVARGRGGTAKLLAEVGVDPVLAERLLSTFEDSRRGLLRPTPEMSRALEPGARSRLYDVLHKTPGNAGQLSPHRFRRDRIDDRFRDLAPSTIALLREFLYERPSLPRSLLLADLPSVMRLVDDRAERARLIQLVSEQESLLLRLKLDDVTDSSALAEYWGRGGRRRDLEILLSSLADDPSPRQIDVIYLLPSFARSFLLTYPRLENTATRDCFWTALNFFLPVPDDLLVGPEVDRILVDRYTYVREPLQLGDVLVLWRATGEAEHAAVYVAGDIYFTKNGTSLATPWLFMHLPDILERYDEAEPTPLTHYRLKNLD